MKVLNYIGWDVGGAHLKVASINDSGKLEFVEQFATPLWQGLDQLENIFPKSIEKLPDGTLTHALTITAELVDIFENRESGVKKLLKLFEKKLGSNIKVYSIECGLLSLNEAYKSVNKLASANWYASTSYVASLLESGLFIDVGSTTTDIIPFSNKLVNAYGVDDQSRLHFDELVYTGVVRTPLMALTKQAPFAGKWQNIIAEYFSDTADIYRILGTLDDKDDLMDTADGNEKDLVSSIRRLARMLGVDSNKFKHDDVCWIKLARYFEEIQVQLLTKAIIRVLSHDTSSNKTIVAAGIGDFLVKKIADRMSIPYVEFGELCTTDSYLTHRCNSCAPAVALAQLNRHLSRR